REKPKEAAALKPKSPEKKVLEAPPQPLLEAFHPRQRIFTDPVRPTHPRQTLINPKAPNVAPKLLANLPNIVQFEQVAGPAKPRPSAPVQPPQGNLAARVSASPEGKPGASGVAPNGAENSSPADSASGAGKSAVGISISGGKPPATASGAKIIAPARKLMTR